MIPLPKIDLMNLNCRTFAIPVAILFSAGFISADAYTLPALPAMPVVVTAAANSMPMGDPAAFPEVKMDFAAETNGPFAPTWTSIAANVPGNGTPAWLRQAKFGIWFHYGPQANLQSGDWSAQHMYQQGSDPYNNHLANFGHPTTNGYKDVIKAWNPTNYSPAGMAQLFYNAGARFVLVQGVHHDNFDNWNSRYNPWNMVNFGAKRDTMAEWTNAIHNLGMHMGVAFHHEYSWWFTQPDFLSDSSGTYAGVPYDAVTTATNTAGKWWEPYDTRRLYNVDLRKYQGFSTPNQGYWNPSSGILTNDLEYANWYATQWALRMLDVVEKYDPDFIYTDGTDSQPFSGYGTGTGYKCDAMQRVIAHFYNRTLERHGQLDTLAVVKFHNGDRIGTTFEGGYSSTIKEDQPWFAEFGIGDWFWRPGISYDNGGQIVYRLLEAISRDGAMMVNIPNRPDGALDSGATNMLQGVGQWMAIHGEGIYGSRAWVTPTEGSFRFTVGTNGCLYAFYEGIPSAGTQLTITSLATNSSNLVAPITSVSLLGSAATLSWSQTPAGLVVTLPATMPSLPSGTAIGLKIGPAAAVGSAPPANVLALPGTNQINLSWYCPSATATFNVKRSLTHGGTYTPIATNVTAMVFNDTNALPGTLYFYVVTAVDAAGESVISSEVSASLAAAPSTNWLTEDVGVVGATGSFGLTNGVFTIQGSGADIWNSADEFRYVFQAIAGDISITTRVTNMQNTADWAKAGVMFRETLDAGSKYVVNFLSPANGVALQQRATTGGSASGVANTTGVAAPYWVRLMRVGNDFSAYGSPDGTNWTLVGSTTVAMNSIVYVGLEVCSHSDGTLNTSLFDNVSLAAPQFPGRPACLNAAGGNGVVGLNWSAAANVATYNLKRATTSGGSYTSVSSSLTGTTYFDTSAVNGTTYYYVISGTNSLGESANSPEASATPSAWSLSSPWSQADVGVTTPAGSGGNSGGTFFNQGSGADIWGNADAFHFIYLTLTNDCSMTARVLNLQNPTIYSKAGVMIRDRLNANCVQALVDVTPGAGVEFIQRTTSNANVTATSTTGITAPEWIRLTRVGSTFTAYRSPDGMAWSAVGSSVSIPTMSSNAYVGLIVNSHSSGTLCLGQFDNVSWTPAAKPSTPAWLSATVGGNQALLTWAVSDNATGYNLKRSTTNGGPYQIIATNAPGYSFIDTGLTNGTAFYYVVTATNAAGESATSPQAMVWPVSTAPLTFNCGIGGGGKQIQLSWPADYTGWRLEAQTNSLGAGLGTNWTTIAASTNINQINISIGPANGSVFFRLVYP
jgi:alpha-L-fucosidase